jgi:hypothetical protein
VTAKSHGELSTERRSVDVRMGKPGHRHGWSLPPEHIGRVEGTGGIETSQYPEERKATATPLVAASEEGRGETLSVSSLVALQAGGCGIHMVKHQIHRRVTKLVRRRSDMEKSRRRG